MKPPAHKHPQKPEMNVVPYIDVMLVLLVISRIQLKELNLEKCYPVLRMGHLLRLLQHREQDGLIGGLNAQICWVHLRNVM